MHDIPPDPPAVPEPAPPPPEPEPPPAPVNDPLPGDAPAPVDEPPTRRPPARIERRAAATGRPKQGTTPLGGSLAVPGERGVVMTS